MRLVSRLPADVSSSIHTSRFGCSIWGRFLPFHGGDTVRQAILTALVLWACAGSSARADIVLYNVPHTDLIFVLQGTASTNPGRTVTFRHPKFGKLYFAMDDIQKFELPTTLSLAQMRLKKAVKDNSADSCLEAARWALHNGLLDVFYDAASAAWKIDKDHPSFKALSAILKQGHRAWIVAARYARSARQVQADAR